MRYEIWVEGWGATGGHGTAQMLGRAPGDTFAQACDNFAAIGGFEGYGNYDRINLTVWACRLYPTEAEARASFG